MFSPQTVFLLGAGASVDLGLPTGDTLRNNLVEILYRERNSLAFGNRKFNDAIRKICFEQEGGDWVSTFEKYSAAADKISSALPMAISIDNLLHTHRQDGTMVQTGKIAIATAILEKEKNSCLNSFPDQYRGNVQLADISNSRFSSGWYLQLMRLIVTGRTLDDIENIFSNIAFIVFNYDRCLEHFLANAIISYFHVEPDVAIRLINNLTIIHPYGQVGYFDWQSSSNVCSTFGNDRGNLIEIADQILTFTESARDGVAAEVKHLISGAETLVFMGFGYLPQNMELLGVQEASVRRVFATMHGIGDSDIAVAEAEIAKMIGKNIHFEGMLQGGLNDSEYYQSYVERGTCRELMDHHWLRLTRQ